MDYGEPYVSPIVNIKPSRPKNKVVKLMGGISYLTLKKNPTNINELTAYCVSTHMLIK
jgi:hypothetical protein